MTTAGEALTWTSASHLPAAERGGDAQSFWPSAWIALQPVTSGRSSRAASSGARSQPIDVAPISTARGLLRRDDLLQGRHEGLRRIGGQQRIVDQHDPVGRAQRRRVAARRRR